MKLIGLERVEKYNKLATRSKNRKIKGLCKGINKLERVTNLELSW
jgi:hypothetical protein